jgi:hypothetical protein
MHGFCNATWHVNHNLACGSVGGGSGCCIQALEAVWRSKETRGGISFIRCHMVSAAPNYTWGCKGLGRTSRRSKRPFGMRASSEQFGRRYSRAISFLSSILAETAGDQCGAPRAFPRCTAATIVRFRCQRASWRLWSRTPTKRIWHFLPVVWQPASQCESSRDHLLMSWEGLSALMPPVAFACCST